MTIEIRLKGDSKAPLTGSLVLRPAASGSEDVTLAVQSSGAIPASLPAGSRWAILAQVPGFWSPVEIIEVPETKPGGVFAVTLWPAGKLTGSLKVQEGERLPREINARVESPPRASRKLEIPRAQVVCPADEKGTWPCELPAGVLDVGFRADDFVPVYHWGISLKHQETINIGPLLLKKGASLSGWVEVEEGKLEPARCVARLLPLSGPGQPTPRGEERLRNTAVEGKVGKDGFFQIEGVPPGTYQLEVEHPGYAPARALPLGVWEGSETVLKQPVVLRRPLEISFELQPPLDWLDKPWQVTVHRMSDFSGNIEKSPAYQGPATAEGRVKLAGQAPGRFMVDVADSLGNDLYHERDVRIQDTGDAQRTSALARIDPPLLVKSDPPALLIELVLQYGFEAGPRPGVRGGWCSGTIAEHEKAATALHGVRRAVSGGSASGPAPAGL